MWKLVKQLFCKHHYKYIGRKNKRYWFDLYKCTKCDKEKYE